MIRIFSCFSGVAGLELGIPFKHEIVGFCENDKWCSSVLKHNYPNVPNYGDITKLDVTKLPSFDMLIGGSPCTGFSVAGKMQGFDNPASRLFFEYVKILNIKKPKYFIFENVKGLFAIDGGWEFTIVISALASCGYNISWSTISPNFLGIPLQRERIFIFGVRGEKTTHVSFKPNGSISQETHRRQAQFVLVATDWKGPSKQRARIIVNDGNGIRCLTPVERERLMGYPVDWTKYGIDEKDQKIEISKTQRVKMTGNGVSANCIKFLLEKTGFANEIFIHNHHV